MLRNFKKSVFIALTFTLGLAFAVPVKAQMILPQALTQFTDGNGSPLAGGSVYFYIPNTLTYKTTWNDSSYTVQNANPVLLDGNGRAPIWGKGIYRQIVKDINGNQIWDRNTSVIDLTSAAITGGTLSGVTISSSTFTNGTISTTTITGATIGAATMTGDLVLYSGAPLTSSSAAPRSYVDTQVSSVSGVPVGAVIAFNLTACPTGWAAANGAGTTVDMRGYFVRGLDTGGAIDPSRTLGSLQQDQLQDHTHGVAFRVSANGTGSAEEIQNYPSTGYYATSPPLTGNHGTETRPKNIALLYCQKS